MAAMTPTAKPVNKDQTSQAASHLLLVVPPFQGLRCPALIVSQLKGNLQQDGFDAEVLYLNLRFAERIRPRVHEWISGTGPYLFGEFIFSTVVHDRGQEDLRAYI